MLGGIVVPIVAQHNVAVAYMIPAFILTCGVLCFVAGRSRYCISKPRGDLLRGICNNDKTDLENEYDGSASSTLSLWSTFKVCALIIPFNIGYSQMATTFIIQGTVMRKAFGFLDAPSMNNCDAFVRNTSLWKKCFDSCLSWHMFSRTSSLSGFFSKVCFIVWIHYWTKALSVVGHERNQGLHDSQVCLGMFPGITFRFVGLGGGISNP
jgi:hypothetical protein